MSSFPVTVSCAIVVVAKLALPVKVVLPLATNVDKVEVFVTVKLAIVVVAKVAMLVNCTAPLAIKVFKVEVFVTVRLLMVEVAKLEIPFTVKFPAIIWLPDITELLLVVALPVIVNPAKVGVDVVVTLWLMEEVPNKNKL